MITRLFCPSASARSISDISLDDLQAVGIDSLLLDLDNTIVEWQKYEISDPVLRWLDDARARGIKLCITSNTHNPSRLNKIAERLGVPCVSRALKPRRLAFERSMDLIGASPAGTAVIGDQLLTDIFGGNRSGLYTILVTPIHKREFIGTKLGRAFEWALLSWFRMRGLTGTKRTSQQSEREERA